jgi:Family of unknown function (DUF5681)
MWFSLWSANRQPGKRSAQERPLPADGPKEYEVGYKKPPLASRFKSGKSANPRGRPRGSPSLATLLQRALDAPANKGEDKPRRLSKREQMVRKLVERSAEADLAATKLLLELLRRADPQALAPDPAQPGPIGGDALSQLKERLARLARAQLAGAAAASKPADPPSPPAGPGSQPPDQPDPE